MVAREQLSTQENNNGILPALPNVNNAAGLNDLSTGRIFALLSLVETCATLPGQPLGGGVFV